MSNLRSAVDEVLGQDPHCFADVELAERLVELERQMARLMAARLATLAVLEARHADAPSTKATNPSKDRRHNH